MNTPMVAAFGRQGCIFEGSVEHTYCFVPADMIVADDQGVHIAEADYVRGGWDVRNMRCNETSDGQRLFPNAARLVNDMTAVPVRNFLQRIFGNARG